MTLDDAKDWLNQEGYVSCKEKASDIVFNAMLWEGGAVILRQASPVPVELYIVSLDVFAEKFAPLGD